MPWMKGQSGNPEGRPKGSRDALTKEFIDNLAADFAEHGAAAIQKVRSVDPVTASLGCPIRPIVHPAMG